MRIFQTFVLPDDLVAKYKLSFAAANFSRNLISGGAFDKVYSLLQVNVSGDLPAIDEKGYEVVYSDWRKKGGVYAKFAIFAEQWQIFNKVKKGDLVWFYNMNMINGFLFLLLKILKPSVKLYIIVLDFTPAEHWYQQNFFFLKLINAANGTICLSPSQLFTVKNTAILPGVVPINEEEQPKIKRLNRDFLLSGVVSNAISMTTKVLEAFAQCSECTLHITGKVLEGEELIKEYATRYSNIKYYGSIPFSEYIDLLHKITFQLSTRNPDYPENQCNFPSKIIEALLHNRIIVSTIHYSQLEGVDYIEIDSNNLINEIKRINSMSDELLMSYANESDKVKLKFSTDIWNETMLKIENA